LQNFTPVSALIGGAMIGLACVILMLNNGRIAGASGIIGGVIGGNAQHRNWRIAFLLGLFCSAWLWLDFVDPQPAFRDSVSPILLIVSGFLVGFGTRLGSGCTSGHGICGLALFSKRSLWATLTFMAFGFISVFALRHIGG
jgi:uncharacterized protein